MIGKCNVLNVRTSAHFQWNGQTGATRGFCDFESEEKCRRVGIYLLKRSYKRAGVKTVAQIINRWAPANENDTQAYIAFVCQMTSFKPSDVMCFDSDYASLLAAMEIMEMGVGKMLRSSYFDKARNAYLHICTTYNI